MRSAGSGVSASWESKSAEVFAFSAMASVGNWDSEQNTVRVWRSCMLRLGIESIE
jgi:hypothetical protein